MLNVSHQHVSLPEYSDESCLVDDTPWNPRWLRDNIRYDRSLPLSLCVVLQMPANVSCIIQTENELNGIFNVMHTRKKRETKNRSKKDVNRNGENVLRLKNG